MGQKRKRCKSCDSLFYPQSSFQVVCSPDCAIAYCKTQAAAGIRKKLERAEHREAKKRVKSRSQWRSEAQQAFNAYIRERDKDEPCISCGRFHNGQWHAGHYRTTAAAPELRFNEDNCHKQCAPCNNHLSGNLIPYRDRLADKIGYDRLIALEGPTKPKKYTIEELSAIKDAYKQRLKSMRDSPCG